MSINKNREDYRLYKIWSDMKYRCSNPNCKKYHLYGGRGIKISENWMSYINFYNDMWQSYQEHCREFGVKDTTIDRINPDKGYYAENCRWATNQEQRINVRDKETYIAINIQNGDIFKFNNLTEFCKKYGFTRQRATECISGKKEQHKGYIFKKLDK